MRGRLWGLVVGFAVGGWLMATPAAQSYVWGSINGIPYGPGLVLSGPILFSPDGSYAIGAVGANRPGSINIGGGSVTGSSTFNTAVISTTLNTNGVVDGVFRMAITNTAVGANSLAFAIYGGAAGATSLFKVDMVGTGTFAGSLYGSNVFAAATGRIGMDGRSNWTSGSDGTITGNNSALTGLITTNFGAPSGNTARGSSSLTNGLVTIDMATATGTGTGTITSPNTAIVPGVYMGMTCKVTTVLAGVGLSTVSIGDGTDADRWGSGIAIAAGTVVNVANWTAVPPWTYTTATSIVVTAAAGVLSTGVLSCSPHYLTFTPIGS
jgi:hypothetical protein